MDATLTNTHRRFRPPFGDIVKFGLLAGVVLTLYQQVPAAIWATEQMQLVMAIGAIGVWRYSWWFVHFARAQIYQRWVYPTVRRRAEELWNTGWRPRSLNFMMTTYKEHPDTTEAVLAGILREISDVGVNARLFIGLGDKSDEDVIENYLRIHANNMPIEVVFIRQNKPGKRFAIGLTLRAMARAGISGDDPIVFLDGDSIIQPTCLRKCLPLFALKPKMEALTTDEKVIVHGPRWIQAWLDMRFAQRHLAMQSHALSNKVLTLTGRMSVFRAQNALRLDFIRTIEADHLDHWLWGDFRFLSGDDKSTWYWLLRHGADMLYVPDALVVTVERIEGNGRQRMVQNLLRWSGNILRNGARAMALGPRRTGFFTWWCLLDQRIAIWTTLFGPTLALLTSIFVSPWFFVVYLSWVAVTRTLLSLMLFPYAGKINLAFPVMLYANQLLNAVVKAYLLFRLPKQRWMNRGDQRSSLGKNNWQTRIRWYMASYLTAFWAGLFVFTLAVYLGLIKPIPIRFG